MAVSQRRTGRPSPPLSFVRLALDILLITLHCHDNNNVHNCIITYHNRPNRVLSLEKPTTADDTESLISFFLAYLPCWTPVILRTYVHTRTYIQSLRPAYGGALGSPSPRDKSLFDFWILGTSLSRGLGKGPRLAR